MLNTFNVVREFKFIVTSVSTAHFDTDVILNTFINYMIL